MSKAILIRCQAKTTYPLDTLREFQGDLKSLSEGDYLKLRSQIINSGFRFPFFVWISPEDGSRYLLDGHQRKRVLNTLVNEGWELPEVPVVLVEADSYGDAKKQILAASSQYGKMEGQGLYEFMHDSDIGMDFLTENYRLPDIDYTSFEAEFFSDALNEGISNPDQDDVVPKAKNNELGVQIGDIWALGKHRLMCGDSTNLSHVNALVSHRASVTFTSPPYNAGCFGGISKYKEKGGDSKTEEDYFNFLVLFTDIALQHSDIVLMNNQFLSGNRKPLARFLGKYHTDIKDIFYWVKATAPPNISKGVFTNRVEIIVALEKDSKKKSFDVDWQGRYSNLIEGPTAASENVSDGTHSATMPIYVPLWFIERLHFIESIYEPFCGSGTTIIACEKTGRVCYAMELDPHYCSITIKRWQDYTNHTAKLLKNIGDVSR